MLGTGNIGLNRNDNIALNRNLVLFVYIKLVVQETDKAP